MKSLAVFACLVAYVTAHTCLVVPAQRGGFEQKTLQTVGADQCARVDNSPCGGIPHDQYAVGIYRAYESYQIVFQKNRDHFYAPNPGYFELKVLVDEREPNEYLARVRDSDRVKNLQFITANVTMPEEGLTLQLKYVTNNPDAPAVFYQCSDIFVSPP